MADERPTVVVQPQASGNPVVVATGVIDALKAQPTLLVIVVLNLAMIIGAAFYLVKLVEYRHLERLELFKLIDKKGLGDDDARPARHRADWSKIMKGPLT